MRMRSWQDQTRSAKEGILRSGLCLRRPQEKDIEPRGTYYPAAVCQNMPISSGCRSFRGADLGDPAVRIQLSATSVASDGCYG